jgi:uncharacterized OB-fold protein
MTSTYNRPLPNPQPEWDYYWEKAKAHELWIMRCNACNQAYFYPRAICPNCFSRDTRWIKASGRGTLFAFAIVHRAPTPAFADMTPFVTAFVQLEEGPRFPTNLVEVHADPSTIKIGMPVEVVFDNVTDAITLPKFRPAH